ncbi:MAG: 16S rRNA (adenine(1518)-N(6)/adenine(1519)-N(6))-dimethyltransferase RsmA [Paludibacteraceae bacterium]|nr:16S rRNA (adenine(1518)-N(6)/adenine(1519)-N(6))-dimethyltransferase RsmA [Paludibacteraceae bacterium]
MTDVRAKKSLGQHFLVDMSVAKGVADSLRVESPTRVLEIGPGMGALTQFLLQDPNINLTAIEVDRESVDYLKLNYPQLDVVSGDFLRLPLETIVPEGDFYVVGNYPYNISTQIFFKILEYRDRIPVAAGMLQKEVAERFAAPPGSRTYGITSVLLQAFYNIEYLFTVHEHVFSPPPKVKSAVIRMERNEVKHLPCNEQLFVKVVKTAFGQRRKTLRNSLKSLTGDSPLPSQYLLQRPECLSVEQFVELTNEIERILESKK